MKDVRQRKPTQTATPNAGDEEGPWSSRWERGRENHVTHEGSGIKMALSCLAALESEDKEAIPLKFRMKMVSN